MNRAYHWGLSPRPRPAARQNEVAYLAGHDGRLLSPWQVPGTLDDHPSHVRQGGDQRVGGRHRAGIGRAMHDQNRHLQLGAAPAQFGFVTLIKVGLSCPNKGNRTY